MTKVDLVVRGGTVADGSGGPIFEGDVAIDAGKIVAVGRVAETGREEIDARGLLVTPGFIDMHTHYDGQLTWSDELAPSSSHGVTTVVTGNCGVGFAPCREADRDNLIEMMEGVEDIPEAVMAEGLPWDWESFPDFLDAVERRPHDIDFAVLLPHSPLRVHVMGRRAIDLDPATAEDCAKMRAIAKSAVLAGAIGFGTSAHYFHRTRGGAHIPSNVAEEAELLQIALGLSDAGRGILQANTDTGDAKVEDYEALHRVARAAGRPISYLLLQQMTPGPELWREILAAIERDNAAGAEIKAQVFNRSPGVLLGLPLSFNPFSAHPFYAKELAHLPLEARVAAMRKPEVRERLLTPEPPVNAMMQLLVSGFEYMFLLGEQPNYEPDASSSIAAIAAARGVTPEAVVYDMLIEDGGRAILFKAACNYREYSLDSTLELMKRPDTVLGLGDGGAHYGTICDASYSTWTLTHWARDRRGERLGLAEAVRILTDEAARHYRFRDRGRLAPGLKGDLNVIDLDRLTLHAPTMVHDLPGGGKRLSQTADGYVASVVAGVPIRRDGADTRARPGRLVRDAGI